MLDTLAVGGEGFGTVRAVNGKVEFAVGFHFFSISSVGCGHGKLLYFQVGLERPDGSRLL